VAFGEPALAGGNNTMMKLGLKIWRCLFPIDFEGFGKALLKKYWEYDCGQIEGDEIQEMAFEYGLIVKVAYDPEKHGEGGLEFGLEKGDEWYVPAWKEERQ